MLTCGITGEMENTPMVTQFLNDPERAEIRNLDAEPVEERTLADAEEEEMAELWAADPGNQGA